MERRVSRRAVLGTGAALAAASGAAGLPACGQGPPETASTSATPATIYVPFAPSWKDGLERRVFDRFEQQTPGVKVNSEETAGGTGGYLEKVVTLVSSGVTVDSLYLHPNFFAGLVDRKLLVPVAPYAAKAKAQMSDFLPGPLGQFTWQGAALGLPWYSGPTFILYNKTAFQ